MSGDARLWQGAVDVLMGNATNLMKYIEELLEEIIIVTTSPKGDRSPKGQFKSLSIPTTHSVANELEGTKYKPPHRNHYFFLQSVGISLNLPQPTIPEVPLYNKMSVSVTT